MGYWDKARVPKRDKVGLFPMPEANTRLAALRSGQVDWIEVPPPDSINGLKQAGYEVVTNSYPHVWPWVLNTAKADSPFRDAKVRQAINYCVDRDGLVMRCCARWKAQATRTSFARPSPRCTRSW